MSDTTKEVTFHYSKSAQFRVIHVDGAIGGITPRGLIHMAVYSERPPIPKTTTHELTDTGLLGAMFNSEVKEGIVREMEADLMLSIQAATELRDWLTKNLNAFAELEATLSNIESK